MDKKEKSTLENSSNSNGLNKKEKTQDNKDKNYIKELNEIEITNARVREAELKAKSLNRKGLMSNSFLTKALILVGIVVLSVVILNLAINFITTYDITVVGDSMEPTFSSGDKIKINLVNTEDENTFDRNSFVVIKEGPGSNTMIIKRVIGIPGDKIEYIKGHLFVNGRYVIGPDNGITKSKALEMYKEIKETGKLDNSIEKEKKADEAAKIEYQNTNNVTTFKPIKLGKGEYWVTSDNLEINTVDSRTLGPISKDLILGKVKRPLFPLSRDIR